MRTLDYIALAFFVLWIFGFIHFLLAIGIVAIMYGAGYKRTSFGYLTKKR